jgi:hypothetical protein
LCAVSQVAPKSASDHATNGQCRNERARGSRVPAALSESADGDLDGRDTAEASRATGISARTARLRKADCRCGLLVVARVAGRASSVSEASPVPLATRSAATPAKAIGVEPRRINSEARPGSAMKLRSTTIDDAAARAAGSVSKSTDHSARSAGVTGGALKPQPTARASMITVARCANRQPASAPQHAPWTSEVTAIVRRAPCLSTARARTGAAMASATLYPPATAPAIA